MLATCRNGPTSTAMAAGLDTATSLTTVAGLATTTCLAMTVGLDTGCRFVFGRMFGFGRKLMDLHVGMLGNAKVRLIVWTGARGYKDHQARTQLSLSRSRSSSILSRLKTVAEVSAFGNVDVLGKIDRLSDSGASKTAATLHAVSIFLKLGRSWNWFIELSALDYPLITQDEVVATLKARNDTGERPNKVEEKKIAAWGSDVPKDLELNEEALANALRIKTHPYFLKLTGSSINITGIKKKSSDLSVMAHIVSCGCT
ncbi:hypothetical protein F2Q69_00002237 [Brassica cretica]|uniref:Uncharacterized protein n=1 Tax=Brassica cretica TaxID=69181 RepID=A0A8S9NNL3_BRACR|nr:hypothetical protein F2Q69_00002237 [Brassica cretica]